MESHFMLNCLPTEVLTVLDRYLPIRSKIGLILSGDALLVHKLRNGGANSFAVRLQAPLKWPTHLFSFLRGVRELRVDYQLDLFSFGVAVSYLPVTTWSARLRVLELHPLAGLTRASLLALPPTLVDLTCCLLAEDISSCPSSLVSLRISCAVALTSTTKFFSPQLEHLSLDVTAPSFNARHCAKLPSSLTSLTLCADIEIDEVLALLPVELTSLELKTEAQFDTNLLPAGLTEAKFPHTKYMTEKMVARLPRTLRRLELPNEVFLDVHEFGRLPPELTALNVRSNARIKPETVAQFPRTLTEVWLDNMNNYNNASSVKNFPPNLKLVSIEGTSASNRMILAYLPRTITDLRMNMWTEAMLTPDDILALPPALTSLDLSHSNYLSCEFIQKLPLHLTSLKMGNTEDFFENKHAAALPRTLSLFHLPRLLRLTSASCPLFPHSLREMHILASSDANFLYHTNDRKQLPPNCIIFQGDMRIV